MTNATDHLASMDERQAPRRPILRVVMMRGPTVPECRARAADISEGGCRISVPTNIAVGSFVEVEFEHSITGQGWVAWSKNGVIGVNFTVSMSPAAIAILTNALAVGR